MSTAVNRRTQVVRRSAQAIQSHAWSAGRRSGYSKGWSHGYHLGQCRRILRDTPEDRGILWDLKVLFVRANGAPYASMDEGIADSLQKLVREVIVARPFDNVADIAKAARPDLVLVLDAAGLSFPVAQIEAIRAMGIRTAVWLPDDPYHSDQTLKIVPYYDYVFTLEISCVDTYKEIGCREVYHLPFGINPDSVKLGYVPTNYRTDVCFIGSAFWNRVAFFDEMADFLKDKNVMINGYWWDRLKSYSTLASKISGYWLNPEETAKHYFASKIVINLHRSIDDASHNRNSRQIPAYSPNPRMFEIAASGTLQLTDVRQELTQFYTPGEDLDTFSSPQELIEKIEYYLGNEDVRQRIALRGLSRTLKEHTYRSRLHQLLSVTNGAR